MTRFRQATSVGIRLLIAALIFVPRPSDGAPPVDKGRAVVLISVDGLAAFYFDDPRAEMPTIRAIAKAGASATRMKASAPTVPGPTTRRSSPGSRRRSTASSEMITSIARSADR
jgi:hypothetical protein